MRRCLLPLAVLSVIAGLAARARAEAAPDAVAVIQRYLEVTGGAAAFAAESTAYSHARIQAFGFEGAYSAWSAKPGNPTVGSARRYAVTELGPFKLREGVEGITAWRTDPTTGVLRALADHDLDQALVGTWFELERWAEPGQGGGTVKLVASERDSLDRYDVLEVMPPDLANGGRLLRSRRLWFSRTSGLLMRMDGRDDQREVTTRLTDWRRAGGRLRSFVNETGLVGMPANQLRATIDTVLTNVPVTGLAFTIPSESVSDVRWLGQAGRARLPFDYRARHVWLRASVDGGPPQDFLFDTGASVTVLDSSWAAEHGVRTSGRMQAAGAGAAGGAAFGTLATFRIASESGDGIELENVKVATLDVNPAFEPLLWRRMAGVIGYDVISRFVVTIDYDQHVLLLEAPEGWRYEGHERPLPMVMNGTVPALTGTLDRTETGLFRLDVGSSSTVDVHGPFARAHRLKERMKRTQPVEGVGFGGSFSSEIGRLGSMSLGPYEWDDPIVSLSNATEGAFASEDFAGNIGNRILERFRVTFDYQRRNVYLEPGKLYAERDHLSRAGALFARRGGVVTAEDVLAASPADRAGLRSGDEVLAVDGKAIGEWDLPELQSRLDDGPTGDRVTVRVRRGRGERTVRIRLSEVVR
jgi:PDZ domain-containing protein/aspartyl protease